MRLPDGLLKRIDVFAKSKGIPRSEAIRRLLDEALDSHKIPEVINHELQ
ncbi:MAG: ribbon-helix-helix domain-containing protein [Candidatus Nezhaarchaeales archaeon]